MFHDAAGRDLLLDRVAVEQVQGLGEVRLHLHLAGAGAAPRGPAEGTEEVGARVAVGDLHGAGPERQALELVLRGRRAGDHVEQHLGANSAQAGLGEVPLIAGVGVVGLRRTLVGVRRADLAHQPLEIVLRCHERPGEGVEQRRVGGRIAHAHIVDRVDDAGPEEMRPHDVDEVAAEVLVVRRRQPFGEHRAAIPPPAVGRGSPEELRRHDPAADGVLHVAAPGIEDDRLPRVLSRLAADVGEEGGEAVVVVHRPAVEGMVVALGALDPHSHEDLRDVLRRLERVALVLEVVCLRLGEGAPLGREQFAHQRVDGCVGLDPLLQPVGVQEHRLVTDRVGDGADHHQLRPLHHPQIDELLPGQELVDEVGPLLRVAARHEGAVFVGAGEHAADVEARPTQELLVAAQARWVDPQLPQLAMDQVVDGVRRRRVRPGEGVARGEGDAVDADGVGLEAGHHEGLAAVARADEPARSDGGRVVVAGEEHGQGRHVAVGAVGVAGPHRELLRGPGPVEDGLRREQVDADDGRRGTGVVAGALLQPARERGMVLVPRRDPDTAAVRHGVGRLGEQEALVRQRAVDAASGHLAGEPVVVGLGVEAEE